MVLKGRGCIGCAFGFAFVVGVQKVWDLWCIAMSWHYFWHFILTCHSVCDTGFRFKVTEWQCSYQRVTALSSLIQLSVNCCYGQSSWVIDLLARCCFSWVITCVSVAMTIKVVSYQNMQHVGKQTLPITRCLRVAYTTHFQMLRETLGFFNFFAEAVD